MKYLLALFGLVVMSLWTYFSWTHDWVALALEIIVLGVFNYFNGREYIEKSHELLD